jgi:uncharacterized protein YndB with AHSA1/START domain
MQSPPMQQIETFEFTREEVIDAPIETVFQAVLDEAGPDSQTGDRKPMPMKLEAWPGGRWFRDTGSNSGHLWGHVQVIKPPTILELTGPLFMSYPAANHVQYRLAAEGASTRLKFLHRAMGLIPKDHLEGMQMGWGYKVGRIRELAAKKK